MYVLVSNNVTRAALTSYTKSQVNTSLLEHTKLQMDVQLLQHLLVLFCIVAPCSDILTKALANSIIIIIILT